MLSFIFRNSKEPVFLLPALMIGDGHSDIEVATRNRPPTDRPYVCLITIWDYWRIDPTLCAKEGLDHFSSCLNSAIVADVRSGKALIVLDLCNEGPEFNKAYFDIVHNWMDRHDVSPRRVVWVAQNRSIRKVYEEVYATGRREFMRFEYYDFYVKLMAHYFSDEQWRKGIIGADETYERDLYNAANKKHIALCLNATPRQHRIFTLAALSYFGLFDECLISFGGLKYVKGARQIDDAVRAAKNADFFWLADDVRKICLLDPIKIDNFDEVGNELWAKISPDPYLHTFISLVTETDFTTGTIDRVTEKTVKAFCLGHPTMVLGNPYALRAIRRWGFHSFDSAIDPRYDIITDPGQRFRKIFAEIKSQSELIKAQPKRWLLTVRDVGTANLEHARGEFLRRYRADCDRTLIDNLSRMLHEG